MIVTVNGESREVEPGASIGALLQTLGLDGTTLVVQQNDEIVEQDDYDTTALDENDQIELVRFVGGG